MDLVDRVTPTVSVAGSITTRVRIGADGSPLEGDMFDGEGFVRGVKRKGHHRGGCQRCWWWVAAVSALRFTASFAAAGVSRIALFDVNTVSMEALAARLRQHYPALDVQTGSNDPAGFDIALNATHMGMNPGDPLPMDVSRIASTTFVGEVVMRAETTSVPLAAVQARGCRVQIGTDMLFEQIPAYLRMLPVPRRPRRTRCRNVAQIKVRVSRAVRPQRLQSARQSRPAAGRW